MFNKKAKLLLTAALVFSSSLCQAKVDNQSLFPRYFGVTGGYGSTTWQGLVPRPEKSQGVDMSTPMSVDEGGFVWGVVAGFEYSPYFAVEADYTHFPNAKIGFNPDGSIFSYTHDGLSEFETRTERYGIMAKLMLFIPHTAVRLYSSFGVANLHRQDMLIDDWLLTPTFGVGVNYRYQARWLIELGGQYTAGFAEPSLNPADTYMPFLYSFGLRVAYFF